MRPVLVAAETRPDGRLALTFADRPGHRVTVVSNGTALTEQLAADIASAVIPLIAGNSTGKDTR